MKISRVGIDLAKNIFQVHGVDGRGKVVWTLGLSLKQTLGLSLNRCSLTSALEKKADVRVSGPVWSREISLDFGPALAR